jgi:GH24 family phage-related lysozyme (muramidase)
MSKLPTKQSLGVIPFPKGRGSLASVSVPNLSSGIAESSAQLGRGIASIGAAAEAIDGYDQKRELFETERKFQEFQWNQEQELDKSKQSVEPGQAAHFADSFQTRYIENGKELFKEIPDRLKPVYEAKMLDAERNLYGKASSFGRAEQKRFGIQSIDDATENIYRQKARAVPTEELDKVTGDFDRLVDTNPDLTPIERDQVRQVGRRKIALSHIDGLPPDQVKPLLGAQPVTTEGLLRKFEGFREGAYWDVNAFRVGYGSDTVTREDGTIVKVTKDTKVTREDAERDLARRTAEFSGVAERQVGGAWGELPNNVRAALTSVAYNYGKLPQTVVRAVGTGDPQEIAAAVGALPANPERRQQEARVILGGNAVPSSLTSLTDEDRQRSIHQAQTRYVQQSAQLAETFERGIIDATAGKAPLPDRATIEADPRLDDKHRNTLLRQHDAAAGQVAGLQQFMAKFNNPDGGAFNPFDKTERDYADTAYGLLGSNAKALEAVANRTGIVPKSAAVSLRGALISNDPKRVAESMAVASNLLSNNQNIFTGADGKTEIENNAVAFRHYVDTLGMSADEAAKRIIRDQSPEYQASVKARLKTEDIDAKIRKELKIDDLAGQFDQVPFLPFTNPTVGFDPRTRAEMFAQYAEQVKDRYLESGDWSVAKKQAADQLKKTWGVSRINGSQTVMQYPPERAPAYAGIENAPEAISKQAIDAVKAETGADVGRPAIRLQPLPGVTAQAYKSGQPVPYMLMWADKEGVTHMLNPGRAFVADPNAMRAAQTEQRRQAFDRAATKAREPMPEVIAP